MLILSSLNTILRQFLWQRKVKLINSQLIEALGSLDKNEFREFGKFVNSPFFNNRSEVIRFFGAIKKFYPDFRANKINDELIFKLVYPTKKFNPVLLRKLVSLLSNYLLDFFAISKFQSGRIEYNVKLVDCLRERKLNKLFEKKLRSVEDLFKTSTHTFGYYEYKFNLTTIKNGYYLHTNEGEMINGFQKEIDDFSEYFLSVMLLLYVRLSEWSKARSISFDLKFYNEVMQHMEKHDYSKVPLVNLYYNMLKLLETEEEKYFFELQKGRIKFEKFISSADEYNIAITMMQYCYKKVQKGDSNFRRKQFEVVNIVLDKNMIPPGNIEPYFFINSIRNAAIIKEFDWCCNFIEKYESRLNKDRLNETLYFSNALIAFYKSKYEDALKHISAFNTERSTLKTEFRNIQLVIYYELNYNDELFSLIDSYRHFLNRDKDIAEKTRELSLEFIRIVSKLVSYSQDEDVESAVLLKNEVLKYPYFNFKEWFLSKLQIIIDKKSRQ